MKIWHIGASSHPDTVNGVSQVVWTVGEFQARRHLVTLVVDDPDEAPDLAAERGISVTSLRGARVDRADIVHFHSVFVPAHAWLARRCAQRQIPYVITPHGGLAPSILNRNQAVKRAYSALLQRPMMRRASLVTALTDLEVEEIADFVGDDRPPIEVIADPVSAPDGSDLRAGVEDIVFLGRFDVHHKGLDRLSRMATEMPDVTFGLYGTGDLSHLPIPPNLFVHPPVYGRDKWSVLRSAKVYAQLSRWEGFGLAIVEAMLVGTPPIVSAEIALAQWVHEAGGESIADTTDCQPVRRLLEQRADRVPRASLVEVAHRLTSPALVAGEMIDAYQRTLTASGRSRVEPPDNTPPTAPSSTASRPGGEVTPETVSVVVTAYNQAGYVEAAIQSVFNQTWPHVELIVVDDGSTDETPDVLRRYDRMTLITQDNQGVVAARNNGAAAASGDYILFLDGDDVLETGAVATLIEPLVGHTRSGFCAGRSRLIDSSGRPTKDALASTTVGDDAYETLLRCPSRIVPPGSVLLRMSAYTASGGWDPQRTRGEDLELFLRMARVDGGTLVDETTVAYRIHDANFSGANVQVMLNECLIVMEQQRAWTTAQPRLEVARSEGVDYFNAALGLKLAVQDVVGAVTGKKRPDIGTVRALATICRQHRRTSRLVSDRLRRLAVRWGHRWSGVAKPAALR